MDGNHPNPIDPRPKRRKDKYNPYRIFTTGIETNDPRYYISFQDVAGTRHCLQIDRKLFETFDRFELDDLSYLNEVDRHYEQSELTEASLNRRSIRQEDSVEETVQQRMEVEDLRRTIAQLPDAQRRRLVLYYFGSFTYQEIAEMERCSYPAIIKSIASALQKLKEHFANDVTE